MQNPRGNAMSGDGQHVDWLDLGERLLAALAGAIGYAMMQEHTPPGRTFVHAFVGASTAIYLSPWLAVYLHIDHPDSVRGLTFATGLFGMIAARTTIGWAEKYTPDAVGRIIARVLGRIPQPEKLPPVKLDPVPKGIDATASQIQDFRNSGPSQS